MDLERIALLRVAGGNIIAAPGEREFQAIVLIGDAQPGAQGLEAVGGERRILVAVGQVEHA